MAKNKLIKNKKLTTNPRVLNLNSYNKSEETTGAGKPNCIVLQLLRKGIINSIRDNKINFFL